MSGAVTVTKETRDGQEQQKTSTARKEQAVTQTSENTLTTKHSEMTCTHML